MGQLETFISFSVLIVLIFVSFIILGRGSGKGGIASGSKGVYNENYDNFDIAEINPLKAFDKCDGDKLYLTDTPNIPVDERETFFLGFNSNKYRGNEKLNPNVDLRFKKLIYDGIYQNHDFAHGKYKTREFNL